MCPHGPDVSISRSIALQRFKPCCARPWFAQAEAQIDASLRDEINERSGNIMRFGRIHRAEQTTQLFFETVGMAATSP